MNKTNARPRHTWKWRSLVSFSLLFASLAMLVSGIVLFIAPIGRVAHSADWRLLGLDKGQWEAVHTIFGYVGAILGLVHLTLNWKPLLGYLRDRTRRVYRLRAELAVALLLTIAVGVGSALSLPPFGTVMDWGESLKNTWESGAVAPVTHEEETASTQEAVSEEEHDEGGSGTGWGRFTVAEICEREGVPVADGLTRLAEHGIAADSSSRIRTLADSSGYAPSAVVDIIAGRESTAHD